MIINKKFFNLLGVAVFGIVLVLCGSAAGLKTTSISSAQNHDFNTIKLSSRPIHFAGFSTCKNELIG